MDFLKEQFRRFKPKFWLVEDFQITEIYTHITSKTFQGIKSLLDNLEN